MKLADVEEEDLEETPSYYPRRKDSEISRRSSYGLLSAEALWENARRLSEAGVRRCSDASVVLTEDTDSFIIGDKVWVGGTKPGQIAYIGETQFAPGEWAGVVLDEPIGKNDGSVAGIRYFQCEAKRGVFSRLTRLTRSPLISGDGNDVGEPTSPPSRRPSSAMSHTSSIRENSFTSPSSPTPPDLKVGERVIVMSSQGSKAGVLRYIGATEFAAGVWAGVELDDPLGKNDGSVGNKRYFDCMPKFGLFAPVAKVSRSPSATPGVRRGICSVHHAATTNSTSSLRRRGSRESVASTTGSTSSAIKSPAPRVRLGVNSLGQKPTNRAAPPTATTQATLQSTLRDKEQYIEQLLKERELERAEVTRAASQVDDAEQKLSNLKLEYEQYREQMEAQMHDNQLMLDRIVAEKSELTALLDEERRRMEDLQFRYEEAAIAKTDMEGQDEVHLERIKELEKALEDERRRAEELELESNRAFEEEEALAKVREEAEQELRSKMEELKTELIAKVTLVEEKDQALDAKEQEIAKLSGEFEDLKKKIVAQEEKEGSVNTEAQRLRDENGKLLESMKQVVAGKEKLEETVAELQAFKVEMIKNESDMSVRQAACVRELEGQLQVVSEEHKNLTVKYQSLLSQSKKDVEELQKAKDEELNLLKQSLQKHAEDASKLQQSEFEKLNQMVLNLKQESSKELEELKSRKDAEIEGLKESLMKHGDEALKAKQLELDKMSQLFTNLKEESSKEIEQLRSQKEIEINEVRQSMKKHEEEVIQALNAEIEMAKQLLPKLKEETSKEMEQLKALKEGEVETLKQSLIKQDDALKAKQIELEKLTEMLSSLQTEKKNEFEELKKLHCTEIQTRENEIAALRSQVETMKTAFEGQTTVNKEAVSEIESRMTELNSEKEKLLKEHEMLLPQLAKLESENSSLKEERKKRDEVLTENERYIESINSQLCNLLSVMGGKPQDIPPQKEDGKANELGGANDTSMRLKSVGIMLQSCTELGLKLKCMMEELEETKKREAEKFQKEKESIESMAQSLKSLQEKQEKDIQDRQNEINLLKAEKSQANKYKSLMENIEKENAQLERKVMELQVNLDKEKAQFERKVMELQVAVTQSNANGNSEDSAYKTLMEEKEMAQGQIEFLNSVIVDMQRKNDDLKARVEILEIGITPADADELNLNGIKARMIAPRLFCDICDVFDLHDTEDCPRQSSESSPPPLIRHRPNSPEGGGGKGKRILPERPYCDTCEIFGHATNECEDGETF